MGRRIGVWALLLLMLGGALWQSIFTRNATEELSGMLDGIFSALEQDDAIKATEAAQSFGDAWQQYKVKYEAMFEHNEVDKISALAATLPSLCRPSYLPKARAATHEINFYVHHIKDIDSLQWENIF